MAKTDKRIIAKKQQPKGSEQEAKKQQPKADKGPASVVRTWFQDHPNPRVHGAAIGYLQGQESSQFLIFVDPSAADCEIQAIEASAPTPHQLLRASRFVGLQGAAGASITPYDPFRFNYAPTAAGTLGAVVDAGGKQYILSSNHVLAHNGRVPQGTVIVSPGPLDDAGAGSVVATASLFVPLRAPAWPLQPAPPNFVDCALADAAMPVPTKSGLPLGVYPAPAPGVTPPPFPVSKTGRTTGTTQSQVSIFHWFGYIDFPFGTYYFEEMMGTYDQHNIFAAPGDSGSVGTDPQGQVGIGLLTARGYVFNKDYEFVSYIILMCSLDSVQTELARTLGIPLARRQTIKFSI